MNVVAPLAASTVGSAVTIDSLWKPSSIVAGVGTECLASDANGTLQISTTGSGGGCTEQEIRNFIIANVNTLGTISESKLNTFLTQTTGVILKADDTEWATKQDVLNTFSEITGPNYILNTNEANGIYALFQNNYGNPINTLMKKTWKVIVIINALI